MLLDTPSSLTEQMEGMNEGETGEQTLNFYQSLFDEHVFKAPSAKDLEEAEEQKFNLKTEIDQIAHLQSDLGFKENEELENSEEKSDTNSDFKSEENTRKCLKDRKDVVYKTLLRSIRRFFHLKFKQEFPKKRYRSSERRIEHFQNSLRQFVTELYQNSAQLQAVLEEDSILCSNLCHIIGEFIHPFMNRQAVHQYKRRISQPAQMFLSKFSKCCQSYSHYALDELVENEFFRLVFSLFTLNFDEAYCKKLRTMDANKETYDQALKEVSMKCSVLAGDR